MMSEKQIKGSPPIGGAEKMAIGGMSRTIQKTRYICISCHDFKAERESNEDMRTKATVREFLLKHNFEIVPREDDPREWIPDQLNGVNRDLVPA